MTEIAFRLVNESDWCLADVDVIVSDTKEIVIYAEHKDYIKWLQRFLSYVFFDYEVTISDVTYNQRTYRPYSSFKLKVFRPVPVEIVEELKHFVHRKQTKDNIHKHVGQIMKLVSRDFRNVFHSHLIERKQFRFY